MIKCFNSPEDMAVLNVYGPNNRSSVRQTLIKLWGEINASIISVGDFISPLSETDRSRR
jgi:hypothetical protein